MVGCHIVGTGVALLALTDIAERIGLTHRIISLGAGDARLTQRLGHRQLFRVGGTLDAGCDRFGTLEVRNSDRLRAIELRDSDRLWSVVTRRLGGFQRRPQEVHPQLGEAEPAAGVDAELRRRECPVRYAPLAQVVQRLRRLQPDEEHLRRAEGDPRGDQAVQSHLRRGVDEVRHGSDFPVQQRQHMEVSEGAQPLEPLLDTGCISHRVGIQERDLDVLIGLRIPGPVPPPQPARGQILADAVATGNRRRLPGGGLGLLLRGVGRLLVDAVGRVLCARLDGFA